MMVKNKLKAKLHKWKEKIGNKLFAGKRRKKLNNTDFSIICNNCWGGFVYRYFGLPYLSPTVGLYFYSEDFIKFAKDIHKYITMPITIISAKNSRHYEDLKRKGQENIPVGILDDVEIIFLHYKTPEEAKEKWTRRCKRVNFNNIVLKYSYMNDPNEDCLKEFDAIPVKKKIMFVQNKEQETKYQCARYYPGYENCKDIRNDTDQFAKYVNLVDLIND